MFEIYSVRMDDRLAARSQSAKAVPVRRGNGNHRCRLSKEFLLKGTALHRIEHQSTTSTQLLSALTYLPCKPPLNVLRVQHPGQIRTHQFWRDSSEMRLLKYGHIVTGLPNLFQCLYHLGGSCRPRDF